MFGKHLSNNPLEEMHMLIGNLHILMKRRLIRNNLGMSLPITIIRREFP